MHFYNCATSSFSIYSSPSSPLTRILVVVCVCLSPYLLPLSVSRQSDSVTRREVDQKQPKRSRVLKCFIHSALNVHVIVLLAHPCRRNERKY